MLLRRAVLVQLLLLFVFVANLAYAQQTGQTPIDESDGPALALANERARIASAYRHAPDDTYEATALRQQAEALMANRDWDAALPYYERAIAADGGEFRTWLRLAQVYRLGGLDHEALAAATAARALAGNEGDVAATWRIAGAVLERLGDPAAAAAAYQLSQGNTSEKGAGAKQTLAEVREFSMVGRELRTEGDLAELCVQFDVYLPDAQQVHYADYVRVEPATELQYYVSYDLLCIGGFAYGQSYTVELLAGLPGTDSYELLADLPDELAMRLGDDVALDVAVPDRDPVLGFRSTAYVLPRIGSTGVPLTTVNVTEAQLSLLRINDRNLVQQIREGRVLQLLDPWVRDYIIEDLGEEVWTGSVEIESVRNERVVTSIPVQEMIEEIEPGTYILIADTGESEAFDWEAKATQWLIVTDIGLLTMSGTDGLTVFVRSLDSAEPMAGATLRLYARNNEELATATTDQDGKATFAPGLLRGSQGLAPTMLTASHGDTDFAFLDLSGPAFDLSDRGVGGRDVTGIYDALLYTDRGVYRPGERVELVALLRDAAGAALPDLPLFFNVLRPDGTLAQEIHSEASALGGHHIPLNFTTSSPTGQWQVLAFVDPEGDPVGSVGFLIEDVIPARIEVEIETAATELVPGAPVDVTADAAYLYGAPGADLVVMGELVIDRNPDPFPEYPNYHFGLADEALEPVRIAFDAPVTDAAGVSQFGVDATQLPDTVSPLRATLYVDVLEPGGRAVSETLLLPVRDEATAIGIKPRFTDDSAPYSLPAEFDVILLDTATRKPVDAASLRYDLIREEWDYQWFYDNGIWDYSVTVRDMPQTGGSVETTPDGSGLVSMVLDWGSYRLEVYDPEAGVAASYRFQAGWYGRPGEGDTPDTLQISLEGDLFEPGDSVRAFITAPFEGPVQLALASDRVYRTWTVDAGPEGVETTIEVEEKWGAGAYLLATAFRPASSAEKHGPGRAMGVAWIGIDPAPRQVEITLDLPELIEPRQTLEVPIEVSGFDGDEGYVTLAAVDEGILQLTDFESPDAPEFFLGKRRLGVELRDLYGRLIDGLAGDRGRIRSGGDGGLGQRGAPPQITLVALFSGIVTLDSDGRAIIPLELPDYNGRLRLMAVAWSALKVGSAEAPLIVRDPVVATSSAPRFLAPGDTSAVTFTVQNLDGAAGTYTLALAGNDAVAVTDPSTFELALEEGASVNQAVGIEGLAVGAGALQMTLEGPDGFSLARTILLPVRPAQLPIQERIVHRLEPGESLTVGGDIAARFVPGSGEMLITFDGKPGIDVAGLLRSLDRYPYGCLEQTTSRALPLLYVAEVARLWDRDEDVAVLNARIADAITRVLDMQRWDGSFSLWSGYGSADSWLSAYALDFLTRARSFGHEVPDFAYQRGLDWLAQETSYFYADDPVLVAARAYAGYVLASAGAGDPGSLRYVYDALSRDANGQPLWITPLGLAQLGAGFALYGDLDRARTAFADAIATERQDNNYPADYGSPVRDLAMTIALAAETGAADFDPAVEVERLADLYQTRRYLSTQEEGALLLAAASLAGSSTFSLSIDGGAADEHSTPLRVYRAGAALEPAIVYRNEGDAPLWMSATLIGSPTEILKASNEGIGIERNYFDFEGNLIDPSQMTQGDMAVVRLDISIGRDVDDQILIVDLLPAGFEAENPHLSDSRNAESLAWLGSIQPADHAEYRDDRFVASVDWFGQGLFSVAYLVRAVTPGEFAHPAPVVEAMYQPELRGRGMPGRTIVTELP
ncbi:MAG: MG2 domain-containing protein [Dongiaceae bacterium]